MTSFFGKAVCSSENTSQKQPTWTE